MELDTLLAVSAVHYNLLRTSLRESLRQPQPGVWLCY